MSINKTFFLRKEDQKPVWRVIDAQDKVLGRLATHIADVLRGKDKPTYTPHADAGDYVVVINAGKIKLTGDKWEKKIYDRYTGWMGGYKTLTAKQLFEKHPEKIIEHAVKGMLPDNKLSRKQFKKLKIYMGKEHPHQAQVTPPQVTS